MGFYGCWRVSPLDQDLAVQHAALAAADRGIIRAEPGDTLVVTPIDRLSRSMKHLLDEPASGPSDVADHWLTSLLSLTRVVSPMARCPAWPVVREAVYRLSKALGDTVMLSDSQVQLGVTMTSTSEGGHPQAAISFVRLAAALIAGAAAGSFLQAAQAQTLTADEVLSSISVSMVGAADPVAGADHRIHLATELIASNPTKLFIRLDEVAAVDPHGHVLGSLSGASLAAMVTLHGGDGTTIAPGGSAIVFMDTSFGASTALPPAIGPRLTITRQLTGPDGKPAPFPASEKLPATVSFTGPFAPVGKTPAVVIDPPLRGARWMAANGCCDTLTSHRGAVMAVNGVQRVPERFAIDWVQLRPDDRLYSGERSRLESYGYFGAPVYAVADGIVVNLYDQAGEQVPGEPAKGITPESIGGNMLVIDIGGGNFAFFAHLKPGSLRVRLGDRVKRGQVIALLGNTGNSDAPHLHFHVMDGKSPLDAEGKPYVFTHFVGQGLFDDASGEAMFVDGKPGVIMPSAMDGTHSDELPLNDEVVDFGN